MDDNIYIGFWKDWSKSKYLGYTLTVPNEWGNIIISFVTLFISSAAIHLWAILLFIVHQARTNPSTRSHDVFYYQQQVLLRNTRGPLSALWELAKMAWSWKKHTQAVTQRSLPLIALCISYGIAVFMAGTFSSRLISFSNEVLISGQRCGWIEDFPQILKMGLTWYPDERQLAVTNALAVAARDTYRWSAGYVRSCYASQQGQSSSLCTAFAKQSIEASIYMSHSCPFQSDICRTDTMVLDSGPINSDLDLGLSSKRDDRITIRRVTSAVPIRFERYTSDWIAPPPAWADEVRMQKGDSFKLYLLGENLLGTKLGMDIPFTFALSNISHNFQDTPYKLVTFTSFAEEDDVENEFSPIAELKHEDSDLTLLILENSAHYIGEVSDPWFHSDILETIFNATYWTPTNEVNILAYLEQYQFCSMRECTELTGLNKLRPDNGGSQPLGLSLYQQQIYNILWKAAWGSKAQILVYMLGAENLLAKDYLWTSGASFSGEIPDDQWMLEIANMHNISVAVMQRRLVEYASPPTIMLGSHENTTKYVIPANTTEARKLCRRQRMRSVKYTSFGAVTLLIIILVASVIIIVNLLLSKAVARLQIWLGFGEDHRFAWIEAEKLQLQRLAFEAHGIGPWIGQESDVPVTIAMTHDLHDLSISASDADDDLL